MEKLLNLKIIEENHLLLEKRLFTRMQLAILQKKLQKKALTSNEKTYYYKFIKPRIRAMMAFFDIQERKIQGKEYIIAGRLEEAARILDQLEREHRGMKIILSGSFLFNEKYHDIDAFLFTKHEKEEYLKGSLHVSFLPDSALSTLFFSSIEQISIKNFNHEATGISEIRLSDLLQTYELLISAVIDKEDYEKNLRDFILKTEYVSNKVVLNPKQLFDLKEKLYRKNCAIFSNMLINALIPGYPTDDLIKKLAAQIESYQKLKGEYQAACNLPIYIDTYSKVILLATSGSQSIDKPNFRVRSPV